MAGQDDSAQRILQQIANEQMANDMSQGTEYTANQEPFDIVAILRELLGKAGRAYTQPYFDAREALPRGSGAAAMYGQHPPPGGSGPQRTSDIHLPQQIPVRRRRR